MIKGVNKRVVEISSPEHEYFEKAVLYLRPDKCGESSEKISEEAAEYLSRIVPLRRRPRLSFAAKLFLAGIGTLIGLLIVLLIIVL